MKVLIYTLSFTLLLLPSNSYGAAEMIEELLGIGGTDSTSTFVPTSSYGYGVGRGRSYLGQSCERDNDPYLCMMCNCMREAGDEPLEGKKLVGLVVKTRVQSAKWANDICGVIYEPHQFSWTMESRGLRALPREMSQSMRECEAATDATINAPGNGMDHYHADYVNPTWASTCQRVTKVGRHIFYKHCGSKPLKRKGRKRGRAGNPHSKARK